ncbi:MAG: ABC transporter substrate-binding protein [Proteobacteria bacterium]|nr:ABC transporter substrate-binding protein [Pseudomonadota bacterium]
MGPRRGGRQPSAAGSRLSVSRRDLLVAAGLGLAVGPRWALAAASPDQLTWGIHVSLAPTWFEPAEASGIITPFMVLYALHDAMVKPMPDKSLAPSLSESVTTSEDGKSYDFVLRDGVKFHNGDLVTSADVKFSFERYRGVAHDLLQTRVAAIETPDARHIRFRLKEPWPDFLTFYATATGAAWVVPKAYVEKVGDEGFKKLPIGAGPYKFVSFQPGVELVLEAFDGYWRKKPAVKRLVFKVIPDESTRLAALKLGEVDIAYSIRGELADELRKTPGLTLKPAVVQGTFCLYFADQWDAKSPWHDPRVRQAASLAIDRAGTNDALTLGYSAITGNAIIPKGFDFYWQPPAPVYDPAQAKKLLAEAGHPNGFDAGDYFCDSSYANIGEGVVNNLLAVGIRCKLRPIERAAFLKEFSEKKYKNLIQAGPGAFGNAATRIEAHLVRGGIFSYGSYPDIDELYRQQAIELDRSKREAILFKIQRLMVERTIYAPIWQLAFINGVGPRVGEAGFARIPLFPYTSPYEDITLKTA